MNCLHKKKLAFMSIVNRVKGFVRTITGALPLTLEGCVDEDSLIDYTLYGQSVQNGTPTPDTPVEVESVGEYDEETGKYKIPIVVSGSNLTNPESWVSATNSNGVDVNTSNYITSVGENYIEADLPTWNGISSEKFDISEVSTIGFKINRDSKLDGYEVYQCVLTEWNESGEKLGYRTLRSTGIADTEQVFRKGINFTHIGGAKYCRFGVVSRAYAINNLRIYDFFITKDADTTDYEPYHEPITTNIYLDEPLSEGQSINYKKDGLPTIPTFKGTSIISTDTTIQPSSAEIEYYSNVKE